MAPSKFYAVSKGHCPGIYTTLADAEKQVKGFRSGRMKGFKSQNEAQQFLAGSSSAPHQQKPPNMSSYAPQPVGMARPPAPHAVTPPQQQQQRTSSLPPCPSCSRPVTKFTVRKDGPNRGREFYNCNATKACSTYFQWLDELPSAASPSSSSSSSLSLSLSSSLSSSSSSSSKEAATEVYVPAKYVKEVLKPSLDWISSYSVEPAKSGRATCKTCHESIPKDELRVGKVDDRSEFGAVKWQHLGCFRLAPLRYTIGEFTSHLPGKVSVRAATFLYTFRHTPTHLPN